LSLADKPTSVPPLTLSQRPPSADQSHTHAREHSVAARPGSHSLPWPPPPPSPPPPTTTAAFSSAPVRTPTPSSAHRIEAASRPSGAPPPRPPHSRLLAARRMNRSSGGCQSSRRGRQRTRRGTTTSTASGRRPRTWTSPSAPGRASLTTSSSGISSEKTVSDPLSSLGRVSPAQQLVDLTYRFK
jgi:hypothetical protein